MPRNYDFLDLSFPWNGDYPIDSDGDLEDTSDDGLLSLIHQIHDLCASEVKDWELYPNRTANLDAFHGEPNNRATGRRIENSLMMAIIAAGLVAEEDLQVRVVPIHIHKVLIVITINAIATANNNLVQGQRLTVSLVYDSMEREMYFLEKTPNLLGD